MEQESQEPIVLTEQNPMSEWMGRLMELRWFERGLEEAYVRSSYPEPGKYVVFDVETYRENIFTVLQERLNALLEACPLRLEAPTPTENGTEPEPELTAWEKGIQRGDRVQYLHSDPAWQGTVETAPQRNVCGDWVMGIVKDGREDERFWMVSSFGPIPPESALDAARKALKPGDFVSCEHRGRTLVGEVGKWEWKDLDSEIHVKLRMPSGPGGNIYPRVRDVTPLKKVVDDAPSTG